MSARLQAVVDRSARMIAAAERRNGTYVAAGAAEFLVAALEDADLGGRLLTDYDAPVRAR